MLIVSCGIFNNNPSEGDLIEFIILNSFDAIITAVEISLAYDTGVSTKLASIGIADTVHKTLNMKEASDVDGSYSIRYIVAGVSYEKKFGSYSMGNPLCTRANIEITDSGILIENND